MQTDLKMNNKFLNEYKIPFVGMKNKRYQFEYQIDGMFFKYFENSNINTCNVNVKLDFFKKETFFLLTFYTDGFVQVPCDRCGDLYNQEIFGDYEVAVKFGTENEINEEDEDVVYISKNDDFVDVSKLIYEFILLSIPLRCVHPNDENGESLCNKEVLDKLIIKKEESIDPRWAALEKLKNKK